MGNKKGSQYLTINKQLIAAGFDPKNMTADDWQKFASLKGDPVPKDITSPADTAHLGNIIDQFIEVDKERDDLKKDEDPAPEPDYISLDPPPDPGSDKEPDPEPDPFAGWDGAMLIWILESAGPVVGKEVCKKHKRIPPDPEKYVFSEPAKRFMKPGADIYMDKIKHLLKHRADLAFIAVLAMQWGFLWFKADKIE